MFCWLCRLFCRCLDVRRPRLEFTASLPGGCLVQGEIHMLRLTSVQQCELSINPVDARGNPAPIDNADYAPRWTSSDDSVASVTVDPNDPKKATVVANGERHRHRADQCGRGRRSRRGRGTHPERDPAGAGRGGRGGHADRRHGRALGSAPGGLSGPQRRSQAACKRRAGSVL